MLTEGAWGGGIELFCFSHSRQMNVRVYRVITHALSVIRLSCRTDHLSPLLTVQVCPKFFVHAGEGLVSFNPSLFAERDVWVGSIECSPSLSFVSVLVRQWWVGLIHYWVFRFDFYLGCMRRQWRPGDGDGDGDAAAAMAAAKRHEKRLSPPLSTCKRFVMRPSRARARAASPPSNPIPSRSRARAASPPSNPAASPVPPGPLHGISDTVLYTSTSPDSQSKPVSSA
jgi:hypothetical protein